LSLPALSRLPESVTLAKSALEDDYKNRAGSAREAGMESESSVLGGPEPDEKATDDLGGNDPVRDHGVLGAAEPAEQATDLLGGAEAEGRVLGGPEPDEQATDLLGGADPA
jgi:hypothetical protein